MNEYKITSQAILADGDTVDRAPSRELELHPPSGDEWTLHSVQYLHDKVLAVWARPKRPHGMSDVYSHADSEASAGAHAGGKTIADMPEPKLRG